MENSYFLGDAAGHIRAVNINIEAVIQNDGKSTYNDSDLVPTLSPFLFLCSPILKLQFVKQKSGLFILCQDGLLYYYQQNVVNNKKNDSVDTTSDDVTAVTKEHIHDKPIKLTAFLGIGEVFDFFCHYQDDDRFHLACLTNDRVLCYFCFSYSGLLVGEMDSFHILKLQVSKKSLVFTVNWNEEYPLESIFAIGGREFPLTIIKVNQEIGQLVPFFKSKHTEDNDLGLLPVFVITGIQFIKDGSLVAITTSQKELVMYDWREPSGKPVYINKIFEYPITSLSFSHRMQFLIATDNRGGISLFDIRARRPFGKLSDHMGAIQAIYCDNVDPILVSVGLDRYLRVYNLINKHLLLSVLLFTYRLGLFI